MVPMGITSVPTVERNPTGIVALIGCILLGGIGTIIVGAMKSDKNAIILGIIQFVLSIIIIGYIWALIWGIMVFMRSK